jgi:hypothetical protein
VLSLEVSDVAHRIRHLDTARPSPEPYPRERSQAPADNRPIDVVLEHLNSALRCLEAAAEDTDPYLKAKTPGEAGVLVEEVADVTHRAEGVAERRRRECDTETGEVFETQHEPEAPRRGRLKWFFPRLRDG